MARFARNEPHGGIICVCRVHKGISGNFSSLVVFYVVCAETLRIDCVSRKDPHSEYSH